MVVEFISTANFNEVMKMEELVRHLNEELPCTLRARCETSGFKGDIISCSQETCDQSFCLETLGLPCCLSCMVA